MRVERKHVVRVAVVLVVALLIYMMTRPQVLEVDAAHVVRDSLRASVEGDARARVRERFTVTAPVAGALERIRLEPGDQIRVGATVASIAPLPVDARAAEQARAGLAAAQALLREATAREEAARAASDLAQRNLARMRRVESAGGISREGLERTELSAQTARDELTASEARLAGARAEVRAAQGALIAVDQTTRGESSITVPAPTGGTVLRVPDPSSRVVGAGTPLLELGDTSQLEIVIDVLSADAVRIPPNARVELHGWGGDSAIVARVSRVEPAARTEISALGVEEQRVNVIAQPLHPLTQLGDGYQLDARVIVWQGENVLIAPASALFRVGSEWNVFVIDAGVARRARVRIGHRSDAAVEILEGLQEGQSVIMFPSDELEDGIRVKPRSTKVVG